MTIKGKVWGTTQCLFNHNNVECHRMTIKNGHCSSWHVHHARSNAFYLESGLLLIEVKKNDYDLTDRTLLHPGQQTEVPPGEYHRFVALDHCVALEWYWTTLRRGDIERKDHGHAMSSDELKAIREDLGL